MKSKSLKIFVLLFAFSGVVKADQWDALGRPKDQKYPTVAMDGAHEQKDKKKGVHYMTPEEREAVRLVIKDGLVYNHVGQLVPDSANDKPEHINHVNYVMDSDGNFYLFNEYANPEIRHSSIFDGEPVAGAGEVTIKDSTITYIDADSGHYDSKKLMPNVLKELKADGCEIPQK